METGVDGAVCCIFYHQTLSSLSVCLAYFLVTLDDSRAGGSTDSGISGGSAGVSVMTGGGLEWTGSDGDSEGDELVGGLDGSVFKVWADWVWKERSDLKCLVCNKGMIFFKNFLFLSAIRTEPSILIPYWSNCLNFHHYIRDIPFWWVVSSLILYKDSVSNSEGRKFLGPFNVSDCSLL